MLEVHVAEKCKKKDRMKSLLHHLSSNKQRKIVRNLLLAHLYPHLLGTLKSIKHLKKKNDRRGTKVRINQNSYSIDEDVLDIEHLVKSQIRSPFSKDFQK